MAADTPRSKPTVEMPRHLVVLLVSALVVCLVGLAYLIGRESSRTATPAQSESAVTPAVEETAVSSPSVTPAAPEPFEAVAAGAPASAGSAPDPVVDHNPTAAPRWCADSDAAVGCSTDQHTGDPRVDDGGASGPSIIPTTRCGRPLLSPDRGDRRREQLVRRRSRGAGDGPPGSGDHR